MWYSDPLMLQLKHPLTLLQLRSDSTNTHQSTFVSEQKRDARHASDFFTTRTSVVVTWCDPCRPTTFLPRMDMVFRRRGAAVWQCDRLRVRVRSMMSRFFSSGAFRASLPVQPPALSAGPSVSGMTAQERCRKSTVLYYWVWLIVGCARSCSYDEHATSGAAGRGP